MNATVEDLRGTIVPKSDQLNAEQLLGGPMTIIVMDVQVSESADQPLLVHYEGENGRPFKPCKTMRKLLIHAWGSDGRTWPGKAMTIYNDPSVRFGGDDVGGIRISHLSDIDRDIKVSLTSTRGKKAKYEVKRLQAPDCSAITAATTDEAAKAAFGAAYRANRDDYARTVLKAAYDAKMAEIHKAGQQ
jgi:hypothetical protein